MNIQNCKKILIVGDAGRGKSTLAKSLSKKLSIEHFELDDLFWLKKYSVKRTDEEHIRLVKNLLNKERDWIIEGSIRHMVALCFDSADCVIHLSFKSLFNQWYQIIKRNIQDKRPLKETYALCVQVFEKRYGIGKSKGKKTVKEMVMPYSTKLIELNSWKEIDNLLEDI
jgi:adenylate kinase family enzyme